MIRPISLLAGLGLIVAASAAQATVLTFESVPDGPSYSELGVTITADGQTFQSVGSPNGTSGILADSSPRAPFTAVFDVLQNSVSVDLGDFNADADTIFLQAFGLGGVPLGETSMLLDASDEAMHTLTISGVDISYVVFGGRDPSLNGSSVFADNLTFGRGVPEPGAWAMMIAGLAGIGWRLRRTRRERSAAIA
jgi:hypothetical protein